MNKLISLAFMQVHTALQAFSALLFSLVAHDAKSDLIFLSVQFTILYYVVVILPIIMILASDSGIECLVLVESLVFFVI
jgi:hypothetical protein